MKPLKIIIAILIAGAASIAAVQVFYRKFYVKWKYYTLYDDEAR